jgi:hypothetical protein
VNSLQNRLEKLPELKATRATLIRELDAEIDKRHQARKEKYAELTAASKGRLELLVLKGGDRGKYVEALAILKTGSRIQDATIQQICEVVSPRELLEYVLADSPEGLARAAGIQPVSAKNLVNHLRARKERADLLALEHREVLCDRPTIKFQKDDGKYYELANLSVGQKCTALLIIALANGTRPVIIDQPEDALDITSVYEDVTLQLRGRKHERQFIITTHNPTVAVAADSDQFHVLKASASQAQIATAGGIDRPIVRAAVIQHLEGGPTPFALKTKKYGIPTG